MSYIALARKYRPKNFKELLGQNILVSTLSNAILEGRMHHAFILTGIRGVGKTTTARIIAKNLNCTGKTGEGKETTDPCEVCINCKGIINGNHPDVIEFDAASNTGIEDVKVIISNTHYAPILGRKKVFIIDEVHMLSNKAFNALLKTLEEPPENIVFIFATTEVRKVPITILSRCQKFFLKALSPDTICEQLKVISQKEGYIVEEEAANIIAIKAGGSMRDALSMLDQAILNASTQEEDRILSADKVKEMLAIPTKEETVKLYNIITEGKVDELLKAVQDMFYLGLDETEIIFDLLEVVSDDIKVNITTENKQSIPLLIRMYQILVKGLEEIKASENKRLYFEILMIKVCYTTHMPTPIEVIERLKNGDINNVLNTFTDSKLI